VPEASVRERTPTADEYAALVASVGWKEREPGAVRKALANSHFAVCAEVDGRTVGMGRVIGDGGLHYHLADVVVDPEFQRRGIGTAIVWALDGFLAAVPHRNTLVGVFATDGTRRFYERLGYRAARVEAPAMFRWLNTGGGD
jgi:GNAT superfamily N-acetyltransferase